MSANPEDIAQQELVSLKINGKTYFGNIGDTILDVTKRNNIQVPHLCFKEGMRPDGNCRVCMVEIEGERVLQPSCIRTITDGMIVNTESDRVLHSQKLVLELLTSDISEDVYNKESELTQWADKLQIKTHRFPSQIQNKHDASHPAISVNLDACIQCTRCLRACREEQVNDVIGYAHRGNKSEIVFDINDPMGDSTCVGCGECVQACPTGALMPSKEVGLTMPDKKVESVCPYCGVGCLLTYNVKDNKILYTDGRDGPANLSRLCVKGRYGFDYINNDGRLTKPLIRKKGVSKDIDVSKFDFNNISDIFEETTWENALALACNGFNNIKSKLGPNALAGFGCAKGSNEEAYLFQKLVRVGFGSNNVDHCTRLCHASSVAALFEGVKSGAVSAPFNAATVADCIIVIGARPTENHPVAATYLKRAAKRGAKLVVMDPRKQGLSKHAEHNLQFKAGTDVAMLNAMLHTIIEEGLYDEQYAVSYTHLTLPTN